MAVPSTFGGSLIGTAKSFADDENTVVMPAFNVVNLFGNYQIDSRTSVSLSVNNLFNTLGYTEMQFPSPTAARSINGRTARLALKYTF